MSYKLRILLQGTLLLSAFLLFCFQPMVAKMVLPFLGGAAAVWTTAVLFFQLMLLAGYFYADRLARLRSLKTQVIVHAALMAAAVVFLPVRFSGASFDAASGLHPVLWEFLGLLKTAGIPYFFVSTTAPLLQSWFSRTDEEGGRDPYFLYAASNTGSLLALIAYPFVVEPAFGASEQSRYWLVAYIVLVMSVALAGAILWRRPVGVLQSPQVSSAPPLGFQTRIYWLFAAFVPSGLMLAVTTHISVNLVAMPLVWTLPLGVYLLTFILAFGRTVRVTSRRVAQLSLPLIVLLCPVVGIRVPVNLSIDVVLISIHLVLLFVGCLLCHTALAEARPDRRHLTGYYVWIAVGGAMGGVFAAIAAPVLFTSIFEYPLLLALTLFFRQGSGRTRWVIAGAMACLVLGYALYLPSVLGEKGETIVATRNFFGVKRVIDTGEVRKLLHGDTLHGMENLAAESAGKALIYYHSDGPLGDVMAMMQDRQGQHVAVVGLGAGSIAAYAGPGRRITFFEIDPEVEAIARRSFTFLQRCGVDCDVVLSDGRLAIAQAPEGAFDLIVLDAFSSDAIPAHLVSREALRLYLSRLKPDGVLLFHVSSRYLKVKELVSALVTAAGLPSLARVERYQGEDPGRSDSMYVVAARSNDALGDLASRGMWGVVDVSENVRVWSDDYSSLADLLQWESEPR